MVIGTCTIHLQLAENGSLKGKRRIIKSITSRLRNEFNISVAEVEDQELWGSAQLGLACVSTDAAQAHRLLTRAVNRLSGMRVDAEVVDYRIEML